MHARENALKDWLQPLIKNKEFKLRALAGDASFRSYFRVEYDGLSHIVMDAPPEKEGLTAFIEVAQALRQAGIRSPEILAQNIPQGFLLLSDLGDSLLLERLNATTVDTYYQLAIDTLLKIQDCPVDHRPAFDEQFMTFEMNLCSEWFFKKYLKLKLSQAELTLIETTWSHLAKIISKQPQVFIHRDYHSRNLMVLNDNALGVLDFQDAMLGPIAYDLVSLLKDCYIAWPRPQVLRWVNYFYDNSPLAQTLSVEHFIEAFDLCGLQRHLKVLGVFSRLSLRDNKQGYLKHLPLTLNYVLECTEIYPKLHPLYDFLQNRVNLP